MGGIIWLIIIVVVVYRMVQKNPKTQQELQRAKEEAMRNMQSAITEPAAQKNTYTVPNEAKPKRVMTDAERARLEEFCKKKVEKEQAKEQAAKKEDVTRAKANSARYADNDETLKELERDHSHSEHMPPAGPKHTNQEETKRAHISAAEFQNPPEEESLLGSVEDLMVKGYDGNLSFERDFLGEAMDMISSYTL
jgi:cell division protein FtsN